MKCSIQGCPGNYEEESILHTAQRRDEVFVFEHVPAEVCSVCGDTVLKPETARRLEQLLADRQKPDRMVPAYEFS